LSRHNDAVAQVRSDDAPSIAGRLLRWMFALSLAAVMIWGGHQMLRWEPESLPIRVVNVDGELKRLSPESLQNTVIAHLHGGIITQDLDELREAVEAMAWVRSASLRRVWPDRLELTVVEHEPFARWGGDGLVSPEGVVFRPPAAEHPKGLALLAGADARAPELVGRFREWNPRFKEQGLRIESLSLDARGAWTLATDAGFDLALGKLQVGARVDRFLSAWPSMSLVGRPAMVDMRYSNGLAVTWNMSQEEQGAGNEQAGTHRWIGPDGVPGQLTVERHAPLVVQNGNNKIRASALDPGSPRS
jgi:cell division protein FtsQ